MPEKRLKIAVVVPGRFHAFDLVRALLKRGHEVVLFTNYPAWAVERFALPASCVRSFLFHGILSRIVLKICNLFLLPYPDCLLNPLFGRWASSRLTKEKWDVVHLWSGLAEESLSNPKLRAKVKLLMRGSAHVAEQAQLLCQEAARSNRRIDSPSRWIQQREPREYELADRVVVLSSFARNSFLHHGVRESKLRVLPLGVAVGAFRPNSEEIEERCRRILSGEPLRILYTGVISFQKGLLDMLDIVRLTRGRFRFRFVGSIPSESRSIVSQMRRIAEFVPRQPQSKLRIQYCWADLYLFPTIQDGFAAVLAQAHGNALPILTTHNCSGPDMLVENRTGWVLPIRHPELFAERLVWCDAHRKELSEIVRRIHREFLCRDWADVADDFEALCYRELSDRAAADSAAAPLAEA